MASGEGQLADWETGPFHAALQSFQQHKGNLWHALLKEDEEAEAQYYEFAPEDAIDRVEVWMREAEGWSDQEASKILDRVLLALGEATGAMAEKLRQQLEEPDLKTVEQPSAAWAE